MEIVLLVGVEEFLLLGEGFDGAGGLMVPEGDQEGQAFSGRVVGDAEFVLLEGGVERVEGEFTEFALGDGDFGDDLVDDVMEIFGRDVDFHIGVAAEFGGEAVLPMFTGPEEMVTVFFAVVVQTVTADGLRRADRQVSHLTFQGTDR